MNKPRLKKLLKFLRELDESKFHYASYVSSYEEDCGTVCCALGWAPVVFKRGPLQWRRSLTNKILLHSINGGFVELEAVDFFELSIDGTSFLFYGRGLEYCDLQIDLERYGDGLNSNLNQVCNRIELFLNWDKAIKNFEGWGLTRL